MDDMQTLRKTRRHDRLAYRRLKTIMPGSTRTKALIEGQKRYRQKLYQLNLSINIETCPLEVAYLKSIPNKTQWLLDKVREDMNRQQDS